MARIDFRLLGPLEVRVDDEPLALGGPRQRALLAMLLLNANQVVARARLIDELWPEQMPDSASHALDVQVSRLRKALGSVISEAGGLLQTRAPGYVLRVEPGQLDLERFEGLRDKARAALDHGDRELAARSLREADGLWRGRLLADLEFEAFARDGARLHELRLVAIEQRIDVELDLGRHATLVAELQALVAEHPLREGLSAQLMLALYRCDRQSEALETYRLTRDRLVRELGLEPSARIRELQRAILAQEAPLKSERATLALAAAAPPTGAGHRPSSASPESAAGTWTRRLSQIAVVLVAVTTGVAAIVALGSSASSQPRPLNRAGLVLVSTDGRRITTAIPLRSSPTEVTAGFGSLWVSHSEDATVTRVDPGRRSQRDTIAVGSGPSALAVAGGAVWVTNTLDSTVSRIDPATGTVTQTIRVGRFPAALATAPSALWVANRGDGTVSRVDPRSGAVVATVRVGLAPNGIAIAHGTVWVTNEDSATVSRISPVTNAVTQTIAVGDAPSAIAATAHGVWVLDRLDSTVSRLDPQTEALTATIEIRGAPSDIAADHDAVWVTNERAGTVARIDDRRQAVDRVVRVGDRTVAATVTPGGTWTATTAGGRGHRGGTLKVVASVALDSLDPAFGFLSGQLIGMTNDGLLAFDHVSGGRGAQLVPDLALSVPAPSQDGRAYTFRMRPGIRYSTGAIVRPRDVRRSLERMYELRSPARPYYDSILGARACEAHPRHCDLSQGIETNDRAGSVTFHLRAPDPDFLYRIALPFANVLPASTPSRQAAGGRAPAGQAHAVLAATGPYQIDRYAAGDELRFVRNPHFREWSAAAQPDGYPDQIVVKLGLAPARGVMLMEHGHSDFMSNVGPPPAPQRQTLRRRYAAQLRINTQLATDFFFLNTRERPFDDVRVRRAVNLAIDRRRIVKLYGGPSTATTTCQVLPPQIPGYRRYCPYTRDPRPDGRWRGPDLARARRLVSASGTRGMRVRVWETLTPQVQYEEGRYLATVLRRLGYDASVGLLPDVRFTPYTNDSRYHAQVISGGWDMDYPTASNMLVRLTCPYFIPANAATIDPSAFCDPAIDAQIKHATALQTTQPDKANALWAHVDREITNQAIWLPTVIPKTTDILSRRAGNYRYHLMLGALIDQLWIR